MITENSNILSGTTTIKVKNTSFKKFMKSVFNRKTINKNSNI